MLTIQKTTMEVLHNVKGLLIDIQGVLLEDSNPIPGAVETVNKLKEKYTLRFLTNTTTRPASAIYNNLKEAGFEVVQDDIITAPVAAKQYLARNGFKSCYLVLNDQVKADFEGFEQNSDQPEALVIGDIGDNWDYVLMDKLFQYIQTGSQPIALHKGKFWKTQGGIHLDIGSFITGLEYATGVEAVVVGKPSSIFFASALEHMGLQEGQVAMIGDDIDSDVGGAQNNDILGIQVKTGKYNEAYASKSKVKPDLTIAAISAIKDYLR